MVYVYNQIGKPEIAAKVLEQLSKKKGGDEDFLREALKVYTLLGDKSSAERVLSLSNFKIEGVWKTKAGKEGKFFQNFLLLPFQRKNFKGRALIKRHLFKGRPGRKEFGF